MVWLGGAFALSDGLPMGVGFLSDEMNCIRMGKSSGVVTCGVAFLNNPKTPCSGIREFLSLIIEPQHIWLLV